MAQRLSNSTTLDVATLKADMNAVKDDVKEIKVTLKELAKTLPENYVHKKEFESLKEKVKSNSDFITKYGPYIVLVIYITLKQYGLL